MLFRSKRNAVRIPVANVCRSMRGIVLVHVKEFETLCAWSKASAATHRSRLPRDPSSFQTESTKLGASSGHPLRSGSPFRCPSLGQGSLARPTSTVAGTYQPRGASLAYREVVRGSPCRHFKWFHSGVYLMSPILRYKINPS